MLLVPEVVPGMALGSKPVLINKTTRGSFLRPSRWHAHVWKAKFSPLSLVPYCHVGIVLAPTYSLNSAWETTSGHVPKMYQGTYQQLSSVDDRGLGPNP